MAKWLRCGFYVVALLASIGGCIPSRAYAETHVSPNYTFDESDIGGGGLIQSDSTNFRIRSSLGDSTIGNMSGTNYQMQAGPKTTADPALSFVVNAASPFGTFSASLTSTATSTFTVLNYTSYGYIVQITGTPPTNNNHTIAPMTTTAPSQIGIEQFGINLAENTTPASFGANPDHGQFGLGDAAPNYRNANVFRYVDGETIAIGPKSSGVTTYTISYIANVASLTPGGQYNSNQQLVCTATF
jgi:hypothetical protein